MYDARKHLSGAGHYRDTEECTSITSPSRERTTPSYVRE